MHPKLSSANVSAILSRGRLVNLGKIYNEYGITIWLSLPIHLLMIIKTIHLDKDHYLSSIDEIPDIDYHIINLIVG